MIVFASGLSLPFFFLALFPQYLQRLPRSGEWLSRVKVVMGFFVLAAMLKYLYSLDAVLQTGFLTRERFLAAWVVLFAMAGFYLLGFVRLPGISRDTELGVGRLLIGTLLVVFGLSLVPGMFGTRLGEIEAYIPPGGRGIRQRRSQLDRKRSALRVRESQSRRQDGAREFHRLRLHQLPLDEGEYVHASGNRRRHEEHGAGGSVYRWHRRRIAGQPEA